MKKILEVVFVFFMTFGLMLYPEDMIMPLSIIFIVGAFAKIVKRG